MRMSRSALRSRLSGVVAIAALCGIAASCSNLGEKELFTGATDNQRQIIGTTADQPLPAPTSAVTSADLPPPPDSLATSAPLTGAAPAAYASLAPATTIPAGSDNFAWSAVGGTVITVGSTDSLDGLAAKYGVPQNQILNSNQLASAGQVTPGRVLVIPHRVPLAPGQAPIAQTAPVVPASLTVPQTLTAGPGTYTVMTGDTLFSISQQTNTSANTIIALNNLGSQSQLRTGQVLKLPASATVPASPAALAAAAATPAVASAVPRPSLAPPSAATNVPAPRVVTPGVDTAAAKPSAAPAVATPAQIPPTQASLNPNAALDPADAPSANGTTFRWPVRGRITEGFGATAGGERNDGINLSVPEGTSVKAAEAGTVIYAGNELQGYGNLILIRHAQGWVTAYAHNKDLLVKRGDTVTRGETIAHAGMTGSVTAPQVHFELRKGSTPVNPLDYLSG
jgi:murein DD-endopeptidase MepM/ murein hydrolase activator NlpD